MKKFSATQALYNQYALQFVQHFESKLDTKELDKFLAMLPKNGKILDAGCGSARDTAYMIQKGYKAWGTDLSENLLVEAKKIHPEVPTQLMDLTQITFPENTFDGIWCKAALLHIERENIPKVLKDFYKILKPNGILIIQTKEGVGEGTQPVPFDKTLKSYGFNGKKRNIKAIDQSWV